MKSSPSVAPPQAIETQAVTPTNKIWLKWLIPIGLGVVLRLLPAPAGLAPLAWHYFALFAAVIAALVTEPLPGAAVGLIGISIAAAYMFIGKTPAEAVRWALSGSSNDTVWLIVAANISPLVTRLPAWDGGSRCRW